MIRYSKIVILKSLALGANLKRTEIVILFSLVLEIDYILFFEVRTFVALNPCEVRGLQCCCLISRVCGK